MSNKYVLKFTKKAQKDFNKINKKDRLLLLKYIKDNLKDTSNPFRYDLDMSKLKGSSNLYRYRVGRYRIICKIEKSELIIVVVNVNKRDDNAYQFI